MVIDPLAVLRGAYSLEESLEGDLHRVSQICSSPMVTVSKENHPLGEGLTGRPPVPACHGGRYITYRSPTLPHHTSHPLPFTHRNPPQTTTRARTPDPAPIYPYHTTTPTITTPAPSSRTTPNHAVTHRIICCRAILQPGSDQNVFQSQPASPPEPIQFPPARRALLLLQPAALAGDSPPLSRSQIDTFLDIFFNRYPINRATSSLD